jgi:hypothetical protein
MKPDTRKRLRERAAEFGLILACDGWPAPKSTPVQPRPFPVQDAKREEATA